MIGSLERIATRTWALHFKLSRFVWWLAVPALLALAALVPNLEFSIAALFLAVMAVAGGVRWHQARRRCRGSMVIPLFFEGGGAEGHAEEAQRNIVDTLRRHLPSSVRDTVQPLAVVIGADEDQFAEKTRKRLRATFVLHGRLAASPGGGWSVFPRLLEPALKTTTHWDWFTRDVTPANPRFGPFVTRLRPQLGVLDEEFPFDFCRDLEALLRGITGRVAQVVGAHDEAVELLDKALVVAGDSTNAQIDALRVSRALSLVELDKGDAAIESLRERAWGEDPSPHLLRSLAHLLLRRANALAHESQDFGRADRDEAVRALRLAREDDTDPQRDQTTYNLLALLEPDTQGERDRQETYRLLDELLSADTGYQRQWYVRRAAGVRAWRELERAWTKGDPEKVKAAGKEAGKWYSRAIRARPRVQLDYVGFAPPFLKWHLIPRSPILYANAHDGHRYAGHRLRAWWLEWRFLRLRKTFQKRGWKRIETRQWRAAHAFFEWIYIVGRNDELEAWAHTYAAICLWKDGRTDEAEHAWKRARTRGPVTLLARANLAWFLEQWGLDSSVPGDEPTDEEGVTDLVEHELQQSLPAPLHEPSNEVGT